MASVFAKALVVAFVVLTMDFVGASGPPFGLVQGRQTHLPPGASFRLSIQYAAR